MGRLIEYCADIEGNVRFWNSFLAASQTISRDDERGLFVREDCVFVFGGDAIDRGGSADSKGQGDLKILEDLVSLKKRCPDQVDLIIGNRDANKIRLPYELHPSVLARRARAFWAEDKRDISFEKGPEKRAVRLRDFVFPATMGAPVAFEARRTELKARGLPHSDDDVVVSYLDTLNRGGLLAEFLSLAQLASIRGDVAFVHGGVTPTNLGFVPPRRHSSPEDMGTMVDDVKSWIEALNAFAKDEVADFLKTCDSYLALPSIDPWSWTSGYKHDQPGSRLTQYCSGRMADGQDARSVIYCSYVAGGKPFPPDPNVERALAEAGIRLLVVGHQPYADAPYFSHGSRVSVLGADMSYSANVTRVVDPTDPTKAVAIDPASLVPALGGEDAPSRDNTRGAAYTVVSFIQEDDGSKPSRVFLRGRLADCATYDFEVDLKTGPVGKKTEDGWIANAVDIVEPSGIKHDFYLTKGEGFNFSGRFSRREDVSLT